MTTTGVLFTYSVNVPDAERMQLVEIAIESAYTENAKNLMVNVTTLAVMGKSLEQLLVEHVEHYERIAMRSTDEPAG